METGQLLLRPLPPHLWHSLGPQNPLRERLISQRLSLTSSEQSVSPRGSQPSSGPQGKEPKGGGLTCISLRQTFLLELFYLSANPEVFWVAHTWAPEAAGEAAVQGQH